MDDEVARVLDRIGPRLRRLRRDAGLTLDALAERTGLSASTLSRVEHGLRRPTLDLLLPLARAHRVSLDQLIAAPATGDPRVHLTPLRRRRDSVVIPLTEHPGRVQVFKEVVGPGKAPRLVTHEGYEWLYVLSGRLRLLLGTDDRDLGPGEAVEFDTREPHWFGSADDGPVEVLHMFGPQARRA
ncbi:MAG TPA: helix-turn-helix domain-containing protein [Cellulomonas sp.]